ncbi:MAG: metallophosphoesterase family protein, partial [Methyloligellaceae bacterium]
PTYEAACNEALEILEPLRADLRYVPGNHDVGDKPFVGSPAGPVTEESVALYERFFGADHYTFDHGSCHFVVMNSSLVNLGGEAEVRQRDWLEADLTENAAKRIFLFSHYPPYINAPDEPTHYDNYEQPGRAWFLELIARHEVEAVFSGHVHQFFYNRYQGTRLYCLPSTSFIRQDYAELYRVGPTAEFGRDDRGKFSYALVDIYEDTHGLRVVPTEGRELPAGADLAPRPEAANGATLPLTVHLRHAWAEAIDLPYNGPMEEFSRKRCRNDYTLARLWQMGLTRLRTPLGDLLDPAGRARMADFHAAGCSFTLFCTGVPDAGAWAAVREAADMIDAFEVVTAENDLSDISETLGALEPIDGVPLYVGKFHSSAHEPKQGSKFAHSVSFGFKWDDHETVVAALKASGLGNVVAGPVFQINLGDDVAARLAEIDAFAGAEGMRAGANVRIADENPAAANFDDAAIAARVEAALSAASGLRATTVQLDTFADIDRSYHPRNGLIDRHYDLREAGRKLAERTGSRAAELA